MSNTTLQKEIEIPEDLFQLAKTEFEVNWQTNKIKIKRLKFGDNKTIERESIIIKANQVGRESKIDADVDSSEIQIQTILIGVTEAPWPVNNRIEVLNLPDPIAAWILKEIELFNTVDFKKKENLNSP